MHRALLGLAATAALIVPASTASSQNLAPASGFSSREGTGRLEVLRGVPSRDFRVDGRHHRHHRGDGFVFGWSGYNDYGDYDANRSFDPDKWNDWWHERPERAFPRWMSRNQDCARRWYSGDVLTC